MTFAEAVKTLIFEKPDGKIIRRNEDNEEIAKGYFFVRSAKYGTTRDLMHHKDELLFEIPVLCCHSYITNKDYKVQYSEYAHLVNAFSDLTDFTIVDRIYGNHEIPSEFRIGNTLWSKDDLLKLGVGDTYNGEYILVKDFLNDEKKCVWHDVLFKTIDDTKLGTMDAFNQIQY